MLSIIRAPSGKTLATRRTRNLNANRSMAALRLPNGEELYLTSSINKLSLGRQQFSMYREAVFIGRKHCSVQLAASGAGQGSVKLSSEHPNPTVVISADGKQAKVHEGECIDLHDGDAIMIIPSRPDLLIAVQLDGSHAAHGTEHESQAQQTTAPLVNGNLLSMPPPAQPTGPHPPSSPQPVSAIATAKPLHTPPKKQQIQDAGAAPALQAMAGAVQQGQQNPVNHGTGPSSSGSQHGPSSGGDSAAKGCVGGMGLMVDAPWQGTPPVMLLLVGVPGSGKSTFSQGLVGSARQSMEWVQVNQDSIAKGKPGTRQQCLRAAHEALKAGKSCIIDRCNFSPDQRSEFVKLAADMHVQAHAVQLQLPVKVCMERVVLRTDHPGRVQGKGSAGVVNSMAKQLRDAGPAGHAEGLASIMTCKDDRDVAAALKAWQVYGAAGESGTTPQQLWSQHAQAPSKPSPGDIRDFFKGAAGKVQQPQKQGLQIGTVPGAASPAREQQHKQAQSFPYQGLTANAASAKTSTSNGVLACSISLEGGTGGAALAAGKKRSSSDGGEDVFTFAGTLGHPSKKQAVSGTKNDANSTAAMPSTLGIPLATPLDGMRTSNKGRNAFSLLMQSATQPQQDGAHAGISRPQTARQAAASSGSAEAGGGEGQGWPVVFSFSSPWSQALRNAALNPEKHREDASIVHVDEQAIVMLDKFPKARRHALVVAREPQLESIAALRREHLPLLKHMQQLGHTWAQEQYTQDPCLYTCKLGFHHVPSMRQLHMHVISQDFDSPALKNKKHWNSFASAFFLEAEDVEAQLQTHGSVHLQPEAAEALLKQELRCHGCRKKQANIPHLKSHILTCTSVRDKFALQVHAPA